MKTRQRDKRHQHNRIEMAVVVGSDDRGSNRRQKPAVAHIDPEKQEDNRPDDQNEEEKLQNPRRNSRHRYLPKA